MTAPYSFDFLNSIYSSVSPGAVHCSDARMVRYFANYFLQRAISAFKFDGLPSWWDRNYFFAKLFLNGFLTVFNTDIYGVIPQECAIGGLNVFYMPSFCIVTNSLINTPKELKIGLDCELIKLTRNFRGISDIITNYAQLAALAMQAVAVSLVNSKAPFISIVKDRAHSESMKKAYDAMCAGEPFIVVDSLVADPSSDGTIFEKLEPGRNYITDKLLSDLRTIENRFDTEIGVPNANIDKKERMIVDEVNANNAETFAQSTVWLECLHESIEKVNKMFNLNISVKLRWEGGAENDRPDYNVQL